MVRLIGWMLALVLLGAPLAHAADARVVPAPPPPVVIEAPPPVVVEVPPPMVAVGPPPITGPLAPPPRIRYGCQRVWRCDTTVCEWRRGCWGVYGYVEEPYYTTEFARRQWESQGLPRQGRPR